MARDAAAQPVRDLIPLVGWLAQHHGLGFAEVPLRNALPEAFDTHNPANLERILSEAGLICETMRRAPASIDPGALPAILYGKDGQIRLLVGKDTAQAAVLNPQEDSVEELSLRDLRRRFTKTVTLVAPKSDRVLSRLSPVTRDQAAPKGHWLWGSLRQHKGAWLQVALAALGMNLMGLALPIFVMNVYDRVIPNLAFVTLTTLAIGVGLALMLDQVLRALRTQVLESVARRVDLDVASHLFRQALRMKLLARPGGASALISNIRDFESVRDFFTSATLVSVIDLAFVGLFLGAMMWIVGPIAWVPIVGTVLILIIAILAQRPIRRSVDTAQAMAVKRHSVLVESLLGIETIKSLNAEPVMLREWEQAVAASARVNASARVWSNATLSGTLLVQQAVSVGVIIWGVFLVADGLISIGALIAANILAGRILAPMAQVAQTVFRTQYALKSLRSIDAMMQAPVEARAGLRQDLSVRAGAVQLRDVHVTYPDAPEAALAGVSLSVAPGECLALLGPVGSGKTTIGRLLNGLISPDSGLVLIDGHAASQYDPALLREGIGMLGQDADLFTGTLRENLLLGRADADDAALRDAITRAGLERFVAERPEGLEYFVGEKGNRLSGGQRQMIALARLVLRRPKTLFLDEPTNALDHQSEQRVIEQLRRLRDDGTGLILCTHRMALADLAERYVIMDKGRILLDGPKAQVLAALQKGGA